MTRLLAAACMLLLPLAVQAQPALPAQPVATAAAPVPLAAFFGREGAMTAKLSPDGRHLAVLVDVDGTGDRIEVVDLVNMRRQTVAHSKDSKVYRLEWVNDERIAFDAAPKKGPPEERRGLPRLFAVNRDGSQLRNLTSSGADIPGQFTHTPATRHLPPYSFLLGQSGTQQSAAIYVRSWMFNDDDDVSIELRKIDTMTGIIELVPKVAYPRRWLLDQHGEPGLLVKLQGNTETVYYRSDDKASWRQAAQFDTVKGGPGSMDPIGFGPDGTLYAALRLNGSDTSALHEIDIKTGNISTEPVLKLDGFDFSGSLVLSQNKLIGIHYVSDAAATVWFDPAMKALQARVDTLLPAMVNRISVPQRPATPWVLVHSHSDLQPPVLHVFNSATGALARVDQAFPDIVPARMARQDLVVYKARDGRQIPGWLTLPNGTQKNLPLVVLVHDGPHRRGREWGWEKEVQFLASRGYAVLEPEYRGSTGFGASHASAGWHQWGRAMQDDLADGARWAVAQGIADGKRICIAGSGYGGYATLTGLARDADVFKCGISWSGITDIEQLYGDEKDNLAIFRWKEYRMPSRDQGAAAAGDKRLDADLMSQAARIKGPLLMAHGSANYRVPVGRARDLMEAIKTVNPQVEWVLYEGEWDNWSLPENRIDFWGRVETFLNKHIGKP